MQEHIIRPDASPGGILHRFLLDEQRNVEHAICCLDDELKLLDKLDELFQQWLFPAGGTALKKGETAHFAFCSLSRTQTLKSCADLLRYEVGEAFGSARVAAEAAFYALMLSMGRITEDDYFDKAGAFANLSRSVKNDLRNGKLASPAAKRLLDVMKLHSEQGAHADPIAHAHRLEKQPDGSIRPTFFQPVPDGTLKDKFLGMVWVGGMCLDTYLTIGESLVTMPLTGTRSAFLDWKADIQEEMEARNLLQGQNAVT